MSHNTTPLSREEIKELFEEKCRVYTQIQGRHVSPMQVMNKEQFIEIVSDLLADRDKEQWISVKDRLEKYYGKYQVSFQFWGKGNNNCYIMKDDVDLHDFGGCATPEDAMKQALEYLDRINKVSHSKQL